MIISLCHKMTVYDTKIKNVFLFNVLFYFFYKILIMCYSSKSYPKRE